MILNRALIGLFLAAIGLGMAVRLIPLVSDPSVLTQIFVTEDGYLLLTVARNLALGNGLSVAEGTIATNGIQPLATFLYALPYLATGGDKVAGLWGVMALAVLISAAVTWAVWRFAFRALAVVPGEGGALPLLTAALWVAGPLLLLHAMNGLETGLYTLMVLCTVLYAGHLFQRREGFSWGDRIVLGLLLGLVFLARNDGAFLVAALLGTRFVQRLISGGLVRGLSDVVPPGLLSLAIAAPWLAYNYTLTGSIIPISGQAQSLKAGFADNLALSPVKLFETMFPMLPLPGSVEAIPLVPPIAGAVVAVIALAYLLRRLSVADGYRWAVLAYALYGCAIFAYYSLFFGAPHFLSRYFAPMAPLLIAAAVWVGRDLMGLVLGAERRGLAMGFIGGMALCLAMALTVRQVLPGVRSHGHFQVVEWVEDNIAREDWVAAVQTGTLGYWHDRTINLDGKVNPAALAARKADGHIFNYVVDSEIVAIADWIGVAKWADSEKAGFKTVFGLEVADRDRNLAVLLRREAR
ncbi:MAG: hypothetical protein AAFR17_00535 [Pseudomonadota bacterium]